MFLPYIRTHLSQIQFHNHTNRIAACSEELISKSMSSNLRPVAAIPYRSQLSNYPPLPMSSQLPRTLQIRNAYRLRDRIHPAGKFLIDPRSIVNDSISVEPTMSTTAEFRRLPFPTINCVSHMRHTAYTLPLDGGRATRADGHIHHT